MGPYLAMRNWLAVAALAVAALATALIDPAAFRTWPDLLLAVVLPYIGYLVGVRTLPGSLVAGLVLGAVTVWVQASAAEAWSVGPGFAGLGYVVLMIYAPIGVGAVILVELTVLLINRRRDAV